jgi:hypothetical protein
MGYLFGRLISLTDLMAMAELTDAQIDAATERGRVASASELRARAVWYDRRLWRVVVELTNGCSFAFPPDLVEGLKVATDDQLAGAELLGAGYGLHWEVLDVDVSVPRLVSWLFGAKA